jgi:short-subunit dehydrogenase
VNLIQKFGETAMVAGASEGIGAAFATYLAAKGQGAVILMSSLAGFQGSGYLSVYASTKAFNRVLAESLWYEWKNNGVDVLACCAEKTSFFAPRVQTPEEVVKECFMKLGKQPSFITGRGDRFKFNRYKE